MTNRVQTVGGAFNLERLALDGPQLVRADFVIGVRNGSPATIAVTDQGTIPRPLGGSLAIDTGEVGTEVAVSGAAGTTELGVSLAEAAIVIETIGGIVTVNLDSSLDNCTLDSTEIVYPVFP
jgi:hypothetical protein